MVLDLFVWDVAYLLWMEAHVSDISTGPQFASPALLGVNHMRSVILDRIASRFLHYLMQTRQHIEDEFTKLLVYNAV